ncbi:MULTISPECIES: sensor histidine kinase [Frankia]|uniref:sensor histidine kinase n=1 Tax=Frankia TaxID=1854 RepID=UPI0005D12E96|nr:MULTISPECIES: histidine kinase [Frankia]
MGGRWRGRLRRATDVGIVLLIGLFLVAVVLDEHDRTREPLLIVLGLPLGVGQSLALYWRRTRPGATLAAALVGGLIIQILVPSVVIPIAALIAISSFAAARPPLRSLPALTALLGVCAVDFASASREDTYFTIVLAIAAWAIGEIARNRRAAIEGEARRAVAEERARIAREIHDVVAHSVSVIIVQAAAADDVFDTRPDQARRALRSIETTGRDALAELRRLLAVVRPGGDEVGPVRPQPGLARVDELGEPLRAAGLQVAIRVIGAARPLPAGVDVSSYRIVGEALTNTLRHARASHVEVTLAYTAATLDLEIVDDGVGTPGTGFSGGGAPTPWPTTGAATGAAISTGAAIGTGAGSEGGPEPVVRAGRRAATITTAPAPTGRGGGHGIIGMRERAAMLGGSLEVGPRDGGGFRVRASLPLPTELGGRPV